jgi:hypothetical protein
MKNTKLKSDFVTPLQGFIIICILALITMYVESLKF